MREKTIIAERFLQHLNAQLGNLFTVKHASVLYAKLQVKKPFALGLLIGCIMQHYIRDGTSFDSMTVNVREMTVDIRVKKSAEENRLEITWM